MPDHPIVSLLFFLIGLALIVKASDLFLDKAIWLARAYHISELVIGSTLVSLCTTLPEMVSGVVASLGNVGDMAVGNAVGSVICNTGLILGILLLFTSVAISREIFMLRGVFMLGTLTIAYISITSPTELLMITRGEGVIFLVVLAIYLVVNYYESLHGGPIPLPAGGITPAAYRRSGQYERSPKLLIRQLALFFVAALGVVGGAWMLIAFGQRLARDIGISDAVVSLLLISLGTSLPELFTAIAAIRRKAHHISIGNIFGANILNMSLVIGASATVRPLRPQDHFLRTVDIPFALSLGVVAFAFGVFKGKIGRHTGIVLIALYLFYLASMFIVGRIGGAPTG